VTTFPGSESIRLSDQETAISSIFQILQVAPAEPHGSAGSDITQVVRLQPKERGRIAIGSHDIGAGHNRIQLFDIVQAAAGGTVRNQKRARRPRRLARAARNLQGLQDSG